MPINFTDPGGGYDPGGGFSSGGGPPLQSPKEQEFLDFRPMRGDRNPFSVRRRYMPGGSAQSETQANEIGALRTNYGAGGAPSGGRPAQSPYISGIKRSGGTMLDPSGSGVESGYDAIEARLLREAMADYPALTRQYSLAADLESGGDPYLRAYGALEGRFRAGGQLANALNSARLQARMGRQRFSEQRYMSRAEQLHRERLMRMQLDAQDGGPMSFIGDLAGRAAGAYLGGSFGGGSGGMNPPRMGQPGFTYP